MLLKNQNEIGNAYIERLEARVRAAENQRAEALKQNVKLSTALAAAGQENERLEKEVIRLQTEVSNLNWMMDGLRR